ncbi:hypothetical protein EXIGLDRAFT_588247, partial [Exidia glandulosa HHB12029]
MEHVCFFRHALALNEHRVKFLPEYARGGDGPEESQTETSAIASAVTVDASATDALAPHTRPHTKEVWFIGFDSSDSGGGADNERLNKFGPALRWMSFEA